MKRATTAKKYNSEQKYKQSLISMFSNIISSSFSSSHMHDIHNNLSNHIVSNRIQYVSMVNKTQFKQHKQFKQVKQDKYNLDSQIRSKQYGKCQEFGENRKQSKQLYMSMQSPQRRALRPKSSIVSSRQSSSNRTPQNPNRNNYMHQYTHTHKEQPTNTPQFIYTTDLSHKNSQFIPNKTLNRQNKSALGSRQHRRQFSKQKIIDYRISDLAVEHNKLTKSIQSNKSIGMVCGYGVNSYKMIQSAQPISQGRILIIANVTKTTKLQEIISLYSIFYSNKSVLFVEFVRQHFQQELIKRLTNPNSTHNNTHAHGYSYNTNNSKYYSQSSTATKNSNITNNSNDIYINGNRIAIDKQLIQQIFHKIQQRFCQVYKIGSKKPNNFNISITNSFGLSYSIVLIHSNQIIICNKGNCDVKVSYGYGHRLQGFIHHHNNNSNHNSNNYNSNNSSNSNSIFVSGNNANTISIYHIFRQQFDSIDYIALISKIYDQLGDGILSFKKQHKINQQINKAHDFTKENDHSHQHTAVSINGSGWVQSQIWQLLLYHIQNRVLQIAQGNQGNNIHGIMGATVDALMKIVTKTFTNKNLSVILLGFKNLNQMIDRKDQVELPFCNQGLNKDDKNQIETEGCV